MNPAIEARPCRPSPSGAASAKPAPCRKRHPHISPVALSHTTTPTLPPNLLSGGHISKSRPVFPSAVCVMRHIATQGLPAQQAASRSSRCQMGAGYRLWRASATRDRGSLADDVPASLDLGQSWRRNRSPALDEVDPCADLPQPSSAIIFSCFASPGACCS